MEASTSAVPELPARPTGMSSMAANGTFLPCVLKEKADLTQMHMALHLFVCSFLAQYLADKVG